MNGNDLQDNGPWDIYQNLTEYTSRIVHQNTLTLKKTFISPTFIYIFFNLPYQMFAKIKKSII